MSRDVRVYLADIAERCHRIARYVDGLDESGWARDERTQDAVARNLEVIGEAVKRLPMDLRDKHPSIPWQDIAGLRDILIHEYEGVDYAIIWDVVINEVPALLAAVESLELLSTPGAIEQIRSAESELDNGALLTDKELRAEYLDGD